jgi:hypothetical protein
MSEQPDVTTMVMTPRQERAIAARDAIASGGRPGALIPSNFLEVQAFCGALATSDLIPPKLKDRAADILVIVLAGIELGLAPMAALRMHHVIEGVPRLSADGIAAIVVASPLCEYLECTESTAERCTWITKRRGRAEQMCTWTIERARQAGLTDRKNRDGSPGMWTRYPQNLLSSRAKAELCRLVYPDVAGGLVSSEEAFNGAIDAEFSEVVPQFRAPTVIAFGAPAPAPPPPPTPKPRAKAAATVIPTVPTPPPPPPPPEPEPAPPVEPEPAPASASADSNGFDFGEDPVDTPKEKTIPDFLAWLAECKTHEALQTGKDQWIRWSKNHFPADSKESAAMREAFAKRNAELVKGARS